VKGSNPQGFETAVVPTLRHRDLRQERVNSCKSLAEEICRVARREKRLLITDTTVRDAHQSLMATRVRTYDLLATAARSCTGCRIFSASRCGVARRLTLRCAFYMKIPGNACANFGAIPMFASRCSPRANAVGYASYPDNVIIEFVREAHDQASTSFGFLIRSTPLRTCVFRLMPRLKPAPLRSSYLLYGDILDKGRPKYSLKYYVAMAQQLEKLGAHFLPSKTWLDCAGLTRLSNW